MSNDENTDVRGLLLVQSTERGEELKALLAKREFSIVQIASEWLYLKEAVEAYLRNSTLTSATDAPMKLLGNRMRSFAKAMDAVTGAGGISPPQEPKP